MEQDPRQEPPPGTAISTVDPGWKPRSSVEETEATRAVEADGEIRTLDDRALIERIHELRREREAIILSHNYQIPEIQDLADFVGDSLQLSQQAAQTDAPLIAFCGVHFMAETAAVLCPDKTVLIPDREAGCSLAQMCPVDLLRKWKADHPDVVVVAYINTTAEVKAEADYCCTSSNAVKVFQAIPPDREILFLPDMFLGLYLERVTGRKVHLWLGECHVHAGIRSEDIHSTWERYPDAHLLACWTWPRAICRWTAPTSSAPAGWSATPGSVRRRWIWSGPRWACSTGCARRTRTSGSSPSARTRSAST
jgi:quinolinate synthetase A subunit